LRQSGPALRVSPSVAIVAWERGPPRRPEIGLGKAVDRPGALSHRLAIDELGPLEVVVTPFGERAWSALGRSCMVDEEGPRSRDYIPVEVAEPPAALVEDPVLMCHGSPRRQS
jgi:hypothetical protein